MSDELSDALKKMLLDDASTKLPTSAFSRLGRSAMTLFRGGRLARKMARRGDDAELDMETIAKFITSIGALKGIAMKSAQLMSYIDVSLPEPLREALAVLQTHAQPMPPEEVEAIVCEDLGERAPVLLATLESSPIAAASIGQVHRATLPDGERVAVKVQYREIRTAIEKDFSSTKAASLFTSVLFPNARVDEFIIEARDRFLEECDYLNEARSQARFSRLFEGHPVIRVPKIHENFCSEHVLTTEWIDGISFDQLLASDPDQATRDRLGVALFGFYIGTLFHHGLYNCDPHPGNYLFLPDDHVAILDYGCTRSFEPAFIENLRALTASVHDDDREAFHRALVAFEIVREGKNYDRDLLWGMFQRYFGPMLEDRIGPVDLGEGMSVGEFARKKQQLLRVAIPGEFLFLFRIRFGLMSVLARLGAHANWCRLERALIAA